MNLHKLKMIPVLLLTMVIIGIGPSPARASLSSTGLTTDLTNLAIEGNQLIATMVATSLTPFTATNTISSLETQVTVYSENVQSIFDQIVAASGTTLSLSNEMLLALQTLSTTVATLSETTASLSNAFLPLAIATMDSSFYAMLSMADNIGTMANRILEMADKILLMADNIGIMADRILATQVIQGANIAMTYDFMLQTQQNMLTLFSMFQ